MSFRAVMIESPVHLTSKNKLRLKANLPENGSVRLLAITERQYASIEILLGKLTQADESFQGEQLSIF